jgi:hypothetical protein
VRDELERRRPRLRGDHGRDVARVARVLLAVGVVDRLVDLGVGIDEGDVLVDAAGAEVPFRRASAARNQAPSRPRQDRT